MNGRQNPLGILPTRGLVAPALTVFAVALLSGCPSPDVPGQFDRYLEDTEDEREEALNVKMDVGGQLVDVSGTFLLMLDTIISPGTPLQFVAEVTYTAEGEGGTFGMTLQPLTLEVMSLDTPRLPIGDLITIDPVPVDASGRFEIASLGELMVSGEANPITGGNIRADVSLGGNIIDEDTFCGTAGGDVFEPIMVLLDGSTFSAVRLDLEPGVFPTPEQLPAADVVAANLKCPEGGAEGDSGGEGSDDGGSTSG